MDAELTPTIRQAVVQKIARLASEKYIFPEKGLETSRFMLQRLERRAYPSCSDEQRRNELEWDLEIARAAYPPMIVDEAVLARYAGQYGGRSFRVRNGSLGYSRQGNPFLRLVPLAENRFIYPSGIKFEFTPDACVTIYYPDGCPAITLAREKP